MPTPEGYDHKATSEGFNGSVRVSIYHSPLMAEYLIEVDDGGFVKHIKVDRAALELIVQSINDVISDERVW